ncbi:MAG: multicopper oxidase domain-containing protein [Actinomycetota bacterium]|nr:multicopper oxidase domain-containing protein [Actinomycetota bacterium]
MVGRTWGVSARAATPRRLLAAGGLALVALWACGPSKAGGATREYWIGATPTTWNIVPNGRDAILGTRYGNETILPSVTYRRYTRGWKTLLRNSPAANVDSDRIPGPLLRAQVGDRIRVHFKNFDTVFDRAHSMHFHGVSYRPSSDGAYLPGFSGRDAKVEPGRTWTYRLRAGPESAGFWPYHDHSTSMHESLEGGLYGGLSIRGRHEQAPDREFVVVFAPMGDFQTINGHAFVGNTPVFHGRVGQTVQWDVMAIGSEHHTFHAHGHRWVQNAVPRDTRTIGPAESFRIRWREDAPGTWLYHCHVEQHMERGMIGLYRVSR